MERPLVARILASDRTVSEEVEHSGRSAAG